MFPIGRYRPTEITKETVNQDSDDRKQEQDRIREESPLREATPSRSSLTKKGDLLGAVRSVFPDRRKLYSVDVLGRREVIDTSQMSLPAYLRLLEAFRTPVRLDDPNGTLQTVSEPDREFPEGSKLGPEMGLPLPAWWELPANDTTTGELQRMIRRNMERAAREGKGLLFRSFPGSRGGSR